VTPVCAHTLTARPLVVDADTVVEVLVRARRSAARMALTLSLDGQQSCPLRVGDRVRLARAPYMARLGRLSDDTFYHRLRTKLGWGT